jgi:hypothetical protein
MPDRYDREARALFPVDSWGRQLPGGLTEPFYFEVASLLRRQAHQLEAMRHDCSTSTLFFTARTIGRDMLIFSSPTSHGCRSRWAFVHSATWLQDGRVLWP